MMGRHKAVLVRPVVVRKATNRTMATRIKGRTHAVALVAVRHPVLTGRTAEVR